jgi:hypothetical protein
MPGVVWIIFLSLPYHTYFDVHNLLWAYIRFSSYKIVLGMRCQLCEKNIFLCLKASFNGWVGKVFDHEVE